MRLVSQPEFLQLPAGVITQRYWEGNVLGDLFIKGASLQNDFFFSPLLPDSITDQVRFNEYERDGNFDSMQRFLIWEEPDIKGLITVLTASLKLQRKK